MNQTRLSFLRNKFANLLMFGGFSLTLISCGENGSVTIKPSSNKNVLGDATVDDKDPQKYFSLVLLTSLQANCSSCHKAGGTGPVSILDFAKASELAKSGKFLDKANGVGHAGGNFCNKAAPCPEIKKFVDLLKTAATSGAVTAEGFFTATLLPAFNAKCATCHKTGGTGPLSILDFAKASALGKTGGLLTKANGTGHGGGDVCNKGGEPCPKIAEFIKLLATPATLPTTTTTTPPAVVKPDPVAFFTATVLPAINTGCGSCHGSTAPKTILAFATARDLARNGASATVNALMNKGLGTNHGGGVRCASTAASPCSQIVTWGGMLRDPLNLSLIDSTAAYTTNLFPKTLMTACQGCHTNAGAPNLSGTAGSANLTALAKAAAAGTPSNTNNDLLSLIQGTGHGGGNVCGAGGLTAGACKEIATWNKLISYP